MNNKLKLSLIIASVIATSQTNAQIYMCKKCEDGTYASNNQCITCPAGSFCKDGIKETCPEGTISVAGSTSCGVICLKNDYSILEVDVIGGGCNGGCSQCANSKYCNVNFSNRTFPAGTKITDQVYTAINDGFTPSRGSVKTISEGAQSCPDGPSNGAYFFSCSYTGTIYKRIKFHYNPNKEKIEVIKLKEGECIKKGAFNRCKEYNWIDDYVIAELDATICN